MHIERMEAVRRPSRRAPGGVAWIAVVSAAALAGCRGGTLPGAPALWSITVAPARASIPSGGDQPFVATAHFSDGTTAPLPLARWSSSRAACASVDGSVGVAHGVAQGGPVTITATDDATGVSGTAVLTVTPPLLRTLAVSPGVFAVAVGLDQPLEAVGQFSDGTRRSLAAGVTWRSAAPGIVSVDSAGLAHGVAPGGPVSVTATEAASGFTASASLTVMDPGSVPVALALPVTGILGPSGAAFYRLGGLDPTVEYLVRLGTTGTPSSPVVVQVDGDPASPAIVCRSYAGGPPCRADVPSAAGELRVQVSGPAGTPFSLDAAPLPVVRPGDPPAVGVVGTEAYYKIVGPPGALQVTLSALTDVFADLFVYDGPRGPVGSGLLCSTVQASPVPTKSCIAGAGGAVYVTVEGWLTAAGSDYAVSAASL